MFLLRRVFFQIRVYLEIHRSDFSLVLLATAKPQPSSADLQTDPLHLSPFFSSKDKRPKWFFNCIPSKRPEPPPFGHSASCCAVPHSKLLVSFLWQCIRNYTDQDHQVHHSIHSHLWNIWISFRHIPANPSLAKAPSDDDRGSLVCSSKFIWEGSFTNFSWVFMSTKA